MAERVNPAGRGHGGAPAPASRHVPDNAQRSRRTLAELDERFVDSALELQPFLKPRGRQLAAWKQLLEVVRAYGSRIDTARGLMMHFKYLCNVAKRPTHRAHDAISGELRDKLLRCVEMMDAAGEDDGDQADAPNGHLPHPAGQTEEHEDGEIDRAAPRRVRHEAEAFRQPRVVPADNDAGRHENVADTAYSAYVELLRFLASLPGGGDNARVDDANLR